MGYNIGPKIGIEGEKEFRDSLKKINDTYKALEAETKAVTAAFEANGDEQGKQEAVTKQLQKQIDLQKEKLNLLQGAVEKATDKYGENSVEVTRLRGAMYDAQASIAKLENELKDTNSRLDESEEAMEDFSAAVNDAGEKAINFGDVLKANVISDLIMDGLRELGNCVKEFVSDSIEEAAEMQAITAQVEQTFGAMGEVAKKELDEISEDTDIASSRMQGSFTKIYAFAKTSGASSESALTIASRAMVVAADSAAYYDRSIEDTTETLQAFIKGNFANDAALGIACTETTRNTKANELYAKSFKELSEAQKVDTLLAMVEAGNEASGAIGQAARESDSWENVTGELAEVMRLLQVEAGKPALKKLVPIIQNITKAGYELIEDIDWDHFAMKVENLADSAVEYGPGIVRAIAAVTAAIVAMKAVKKAQELAGIVSAFMNIGTAATATAGTVAASGAVAMATPWGAIAAVVGGVAAAITLFATQAETDAGRLSGAMDALKDKMEDANADYAEAKTEIEGNASAAKYYVDRLKELEAAGLNTAVAQKEYAMIVEQLNELIPELNLSINEQTGLLDQDTDSLYANIDAWKENATQKALQEQFTDVLKAQGEAEAEIYVAKAKKNQLAQKEIALNEKFTKAMKEADDASQAVVDAEKALANASTQGTEAYVEAQRKLVEAQGKLEEKNKALQTATAEVEQNQIEMEDLSKEIEKAEEVYESYADEVKLAEETAELYRKETENVSEAQVAANQAMEDVQNALNAVQTAYDDALKSAQESISGQIDLFGDLEEESDYSVDKVIENWNKQRDAMLNYADNLKKLSAKGLSKEILEELADGSEQSMLLLEHWANASDEMIAKLNESYDARKLAELTAAESATEVVYSFENQFQEVEENARKAGLMIVNGVVKGIDEGAVVLELAMGRMGRRTIDAYNRAMLIKSPARAMKPSGRHVVGGVAEGVEENIQLLEKSMEKMAIAGQEAFDQQRLNQIAIYPTQVMAAAVPQQSRVDHNYGGINIQIYPQEGQSEEAIADAVFDRIQLEVDRKGAGL